MVKCTKGQVRRLKTALRWKIPAEQRQRIQMVLLRESGMTQPLIAAAMGVSLSTVNRAHMAYDHGGIEALKPRPSGGRKHENMAWEEEKALLARFARARVSRARGQRKDFSQSTSQSTTSTSNATSSQPERTEPSGPRRCRHGTKSCRDEARGA